MRSTTTMVSSAIPCSSSPTAAHQEEIRPRWRDRASHRRARSRASGADRDTHRRTMRRGPDRLLLPVPSPPRRASESFVRVGGVSVRAIVVIDLSVAQPFVDCLDQNQATWSISGHGRVGRSPHDLDRVSRHIAPQSGGLVEVLVVFPGHFPKHPRRKERLRRYTR